MDAAQVEEFVEKVKDELSVVDDLPIGEHAQRLENLHRTLEATLSTIDGL